MPALLMLLAACGGTTTNPVAEAAKASTKAGSAYIAYTGTSVTGGVKATLAGSGDIQFAPQSGQLNVAFTSPTSNGTIRELLKGSTVYMISPLFQSSIPQGMAWVKIDLKKAGRAAGFDLNSFSAATPAQTLQLLAGAGKVSKLGSERLAGVATTHYRATLDRAKLKRVDPALGKPGVTFRPVDVWVDGDGHVRRLALSYSAGSAGSTTFTMNYSRYGEAVHITLPDPSVIFDATSLSAATLKNGGTK